MHSIKKVVYLYQQTERDMTLLKNARVGNLVKLNRNSDVYKVLQVGYFIKLQSLYTNKVSNFKSYTKKNNSFYDRKVIIVNNY